MWTIIGWIIVLAVIGHVVSIWLDPPHDLTSSPPPPKRDPREEGLWYAYLQDREGSPDFGAYLKAKREAFRREDQEA